MPIKCAHFTFDISTLSQKPFPQHLNAFPQGLKANDPERTIKLSLACITKDDVDRHCRRKVKGKIAGTRYLFCFSDPETYIHCSDTDVFNSLMVLLDLYRKS